jgi:indole-3-glycerol phosphate synthase
MNILDRILERTRSDVADRRAHTPLAELRARCRDLPPARDVRAALRRPAGDCARRQGRLQVIAEVKKASPSRGVIRPDFDPVALARAYAAAGAAAVSVLTDAPFFQGALTHLTAVRGAVLLPLLRKDFHIEPYQLWEARAAGADAALLIVAALPGPALGELLGLCREVGLTPLVEVHDGAELAVALESGADLVGVNNRDLRSFAVRLETTLDLLPAVPPAAVFVSESGIRTAKDAARLAAAGVDAILVGEGLLAHADVGAALRALTEGA